MPKILYTYPGSGTIGPYDNFGTTLQVRFNKFMERTSLRRALHITSSSGNIKADTTLLTTNGGDVFTVNTLTVDPRARFRWQIGEVYTLRIDTTAKDMNGNNLRSEFVMTFEPEPYFRVRNSSPQNGALNVSVTGSLNLTFNSPIDTSSFSALRITPPVSGYWRYLKTKGVSQDSTSITYGFSGSRMLTSSMYTISINDTMHDKQGHLLQGGFSSSFSTYPFELTNTYPQDGSINVQPLNHQVYIYFNDLVDTSTIRSAFSISPNIAGSLLLSYDGSYIIFNSVSDLPVNTLFTVKIDSTLRSKSGDKLSESYSFSFTTGSFQISFTSPSNGSTGLFGNEFIRVYCNSTIDTASIRSSFNISPSLPGLFGMDSPSTYFTFAPILPYHANTTYTVVISSSLKSLSGNALSSPYTFSFTTAPFDVANSYPPNGSTGISRYTPVFFGFSSQIDTGTVRNAMSITPAVNGTINFNNEPTYNFEYRSNEELLANTVYTVRLDTTLHSINGDPLNSAYSFSFATGN